MTELKLTPARAKKIFDLLKRGHYTEAAVAYAGVHKDTFYGWIERGNEARALADQRPVAEQYQTAADHAAAVADWEAKLAAKQVYLDFLAGLEHAKSFGEAWLTEQVLEAADPASKQTYQKRWQAYMTILERTRRDRWSRRSAVEHGTADGKPFPVSHVFDPSKLSVDELEQLKLLLERAKPDEDA